LAIESTEVEGMDTEFRMVDRLPLPRRLVSLIESGRWPRTEWEALQQNLKSLVPKDRIQLFAPEESTLYLNKPPFHTVAKVMNHPGKFWYRFGALDEIDPELSVEIGDFGFGLDSPILLDYRQDRSNPAVPATGAKPSTERLGTLFGQLRRVRRHAWAE
jgi:hypothetical protein